MKLTDLHIEGLIEYLKSGKGQFKKECSNLSSADKSIIIKRLLDYLPDEQDEDNPIDIIITVFEI